jgi:hypothetical protein
MKSSIGAFALRFAATAVLFGPSVATQAQSTSQTICRDVYVPGPGINGADRGHGQMERVCNTVSHAAPPSPPPEPPVKHEPPVNSFVPYDAAAEAQKVQRQSVEHRVPASLSLCPPPYRMTAQDGCQR